MLIQQWVNVSCLFGLFICRFIHMSVCHSHLTSTGYLASVPAKSDQIFTSRP